MESFYPIVNWNHCRLPVSIIARKRVFHFAICQEALFIFFSVIWDFLFSSTSSYCKIWMLRMFFVLLLGSKIALILVHNMVHHSKLKCIYAHDMINLLQCLFFCIVCSGIFLHTYHKALYRCCPILFPRICCGLRICAFSNKTSLSFQVCIIEAIYIFFKARTIVCWLTLPLLFHAFLFAFC